jgi:hypothetical protein
MSEVNNEELTIDDIEQKGTNWGLIAIIMSVIAGIILIVVGLEMGASRFGKPSFSYSPGAALMRA